MHLLDASKVSVKIGLFVWEYWNILSFVEYWRFKVMSLVLPWIKPVAQSRICCAASKLKSIFVFNALVEAVERCDLVVWIILVFCLFVAGSRMSLLSICLTVQMSFTQKMEEIVNLTHLWESIAQMKEIVLSVATPVAIKHQQL